MESKKIEDLQLQLDQANAENKILQDLNKELTLEIEALKAGSDTPVTNGFVNKLTFENKKVTYGFKMHGVNLNGNVITAEQVVKDKALQDELIKRKSGMIEAIAE